jgi:hypothetical protein
MGCSKGRPQGEIPRRLAAWPKNFTRSHGRNQDSSPAGKFPFVPKLISLQRPQFTNTQLGDFFKISPEAIRRILKGSWKPTAEEQTTRIERWQRRRQRIATESAKRHEFREQATTLQRYNRISDSSAARFKVDHAARFARRDFKVAGVRTQPAGRPERFPFSGISRSGFGPNNSPRNINDKPIRPSRHLRPSTLGSRDRYRQDSNQRS